MAISLIDLTPGWRLCWTGEQNHSSFRPPQLRYLVQDQPSMVAKGATELEREFEGRISFKRHDFFNENPETAPDVFFLRLMLHDLSLIHI